MVRDEHTDKIPTRRDFVKGGGALLGGGLLAGCLGGTDGGADPTDTTASSEVPTETSTNTTTSESYTVSMAPMGDVEFENAPESIFTRLTHLAGMAFALGRGNDVNAMHAPDYYDALWNQFTPRLDGVSLDWTGLYSSWEPSKEKLYELDSDVHLADPASVFALSGWNMDDIEEIRDNVSPWFGNQFSDSHGAPPEEWADQYEYYGLWEMFEKVAAVFQEQARYEALAEVRDDLLSTIDSGLPPGSERPAAVLIGASSLDSIYAYPLDNPGFLTSHITPLEPVSAFSEDVESTSTVGMEALREANPDVIFALGGMHPSTDIEEIRAGFRDDPVGQQIDAVENERIYAQGARYQGPILNLFQLEMTAKQLYPDAFGDWPTYTEGPYPEIPADERLFDRQRVSNVINGDY
ncbi:MULTISPECIES: ABC transporter substrate-binding protein [Halobacterium]|uniref:ABC transporter substrate-binding protein n=1 Tax=Halobacterium TaxID=2239 RepID=UPI00073E3E2D|nr:MULTISPECIES: ABC transporter substrate-binding protein [Halobacterium]MCG1003206.1 ABC transporter substrate-binding protein [Halobacterium noricense]